MTEQEKALKRLFPLFLSCLGDCSLSHCPNNPRFGSGLDSKSVYTLLVELGELHNPVCLALRDCINMIYAVIQTREQKLRRVNI